jgi:hypothetical protein
MNEEIALTLWGNSTEFISISESGSDNAREVVRLSACIDTGRVKTALCGIVKIIDFATVRLTKSDDNLTSGSFFISKEDEEFDHLDDKKLLDYSPYLELNIKLTSAQYSELLKQKGLDPEIEITTKLEVKSIPIDIEGEWGIGGELGEIYVSSKVGEGGNRWIDESLDRVFQSQMSKIYVHKYSQIKNIAHEFASSAKYTKKPLDSSIMKELSEAKRLIAESRSAFKPEGKVSGYEYDSNNLSAIQFAAYADKISDKEVADNLKKEFDKLWWHCDIQTIINHGEKKYGHAKDGFDPKSSDIIGLGRDLLALKKIHSDFLERLIVDSLIYIEILGFARHVHSKKEAFGISIDGELKGTQESSSGFTAIAKAVGKSLWFYTKEFIKIAVTYAIATFLTQENTTAAWLITVGFTGYRWFTHDINVKKDHEYKKYDLLMKMTSLYNYFASDTINDRFILKELYRVEAEGARFDPVIFDIMERRVMRKNQL